VKPPVNRNVGELPIFGVDSQETEALRNLEKIVWMYIHEETALGDLIVAANAVRSIRRKRKSN